MTSDWTQKRGDDASDYKDTEVQGNTRNVQHPGTSNFTTQYCTEADDYKDNEVDPNIHGAGKGGYKTDAYSAGGTKKVSHSGYYLYDSRDPQNGAIRRGGKVALP